MKYIFIFVIAFSSLLLAEPQWSDSHKEAMAQAQKEDKLVLVMLSQKGCDACWYMENVVFDDDDLVDEISKKFVWSYVDVQNDRVPSGLRYLGTPTFHFLDKEGKKLHRLDGYANIPDFRKEVAKALKTVSER
jgi:thioredoxin-related protein